MGKDNYVYVYDKACTDFRGTGLVGDLKPLSALFSEEKNGMMQVTIRIPYDEYGRWKAVKPGNILKCKVPVRVPPVIRDDEYANTTRFYNESTGGPNSAPGPGE